MKKIATIIGAVALATTLAACNTSDATGALETAESAPIEDAHVVERYDLGTDGMREYVVQLHDGTTVRCLHWNKGYGGGSSCDWGALSNTNTTAP